MAEIAIVSFVQRGQSICMVNVLTVLVVHLSAVVQGKFRFERRALFRCGRINDYFLPRTLDKSFFSLADDCVNTNFCLSYAEKS